METSRYRQIAGLLGWLLLAFATAAIGAAATVNAREFYAQLVRPAWAPPGWLFGPVWSALYAFMGFAAWRVWKQHGWGGAKVALGLFIVQLAVNALWSWLFFAWHRGAWALAEILLLWVLIAATLLQFWKKDRWAGVLLVPYLGWVTFATALCYSTWKLNPAML
jgi:tryptophan-rich sensory protein